MAGVYLLTDVRLAGEPLGVALAFANAVLFALYIVLAHRVARHEAVSGIDGLAASMLIAAVVVTPMGGWAVLPALTDPVALLAGIGVGVSSSVIPYVSDQLAMARLPRATYALMVALLPATATVIGVVVLTQVPSWVEVAGVALVIAGVAVHREVSQPAGRLRPDPPRPRAGAPRRELLEMGREGHGRRGPQMRRRVRPGGVEQVAGRAAPGGEGLEEPALAVEPVLDVLA